MLCILLPNCPSHEDPQNEVLLSAHVYDWIFPFIQRVPFICSIVQRLILSNKLPPIWFIVYG